VAIVCWHNRSHYIAFCAEEGSANACLTFNDLDAPAGVPLVNKWVELPVLCEKFNLEVRMVFFEKPESKCMEEDLKEKPMESVIKFPAVPLEVQAPGKPCPEEKSDEVMLEKQAEEPLLVQGAEAPGEKPEQCRGRVNLSAEAPCTHSSGHIIWNSLLILRNK